MGYRSDVGLCVYTLGTEPQQRDKFLALKTLLNTRFAEVTQTFGDDYTYDHVGNQLRVSIEDVKWYTGFPDVKMFMDMVDSLEELEYEYDCVRVGEDSGDVETLSSSNSDGRIGTRTTLEWY
mgnify:FL=1|tara:strand:+ start:178 stop:543 length:366 start_codon:yes stop_codon:yes gene_type:complete